MGFLKEMIDRKKMDITKIAKELNVARSTIYRIDDNIESAKFGDIIKLCNLLEISPVELVPSKFENENSSRIKTLMKTAITEIENKFNPVEKNALTMMIKRFEFDKEIDPKVYLKMCIIDSNKVLNTKIDAIKLTKKIDNITTFQAFAIINEINNWQFKMNYEPEKKYELGIVTFDDDFKKYKFENDFLSIGEAVAIEVNEIKIDGRISFAIEYENRYCFESNDGLVKIDLFSIKKIYRLYEIY